MEEILCDEEELNALGDFRRWLTEDGFYIHLVYAARGSNVDYMEVDTQEPGFLYWFDNDTLMYTIDDVKDSLVFDLSKKRGGKIWL